MSKMHLALRLILYDDSKLPKEISTSLTPYYGLFT